MKSLRISLMALLTALRYPRVWLTLWAWVTVAALALVVPVYAAVDAALAHHPGASVLVDQSLDVDLWRENKDLAPSLTGAAVFVLLGMVFFAGGILSCLGVGRRFRYTTFLSECARLFPRNLRVLLIGLVPASLLFWGVGFLDTWLREDLLRNWNPGGPDMGGHLPRFLSLEVGLELLSYGRGLVFLLLIFTSKVAMAHLAMENRSFATWAWLKATKRTISNPVFATLVIICLCVAYLPLYFLGSVIGGFLEGDKEQFNLWAALGCGQGAIMWLQVVTVGFFLAARRFLQETGPTLPSAAEVELPPELAGETPPIEPTSEESPPPTPVPTGATGRPAGA